MRSPFVSPLQCNCATLHIFYKNKLKQIDQNIHKTKDEEEEKIKKEEKRKNTAHTKTQRLFTPNQILTSAQNIKFSHSHIQYNIVPFY